MKAESTPWRTLLAVAASIGIMPAQFWRLSLREWRALIAPARTALSRDGFKRLSEQFPDSKI